MMTKEQMANKIEQSNEIIASIREGLEKIRKSREEYEDYLNEKRNKMDKVA